jgi:hypothetical protein
VRRYYSWMEYGALFTNGGTVHGGLFMEYYSQVIVHGVLGGGSRQIHGAAPAV